LTGKYLNGVPAGSRATFTGYEWLKSMLTNEKSNKKVAELKKISDELDVTLAQFSLAWCAKNPTSRRHYRRLLRRSGAREHERST